MLAQDVRLVPYKSIFHVVLAQVKYHMDRQGGFADVRKVDCILNSENTEGSIRLSFQSDRSWR